MARPRECKFIEQLLFATRELAQITLLRLVAQFLDSFGFLPCHQQLLALFYDDLGSLGNDVLLDRNPLGSAAGYGTGLGLDRASWLRTWSANGRSP